jgi:SAM-dependent methyltransferase
MKFKSIDDWIGYLRAKIKKSNPDLINSFEIYAAEAKFGRAFIHNSLLGIPKGSSILEIGAGTMILSCQLVIEGFKVNAVEPSGEGFSHFSKIRKIVLLHARNNDCLPKITKVRAESIDYHNAYNFAFSINVMEHVNRVDKVIKNAIHSLKPKSSYRFICPNYLFPYEPHFNIPILFNKKFTFKIFKRHILNKPEVIDNKGLWKSLNWISPLQICKFTKKNKTIEVSYRKKILEDTLVRVLNDKLFSSRRSYWMRLLVKFMVLMGIHKIFSHIPLVFQPVLDCNIRKLI